MNISSLVFFFLTVIHTAAMGCVALGKYASSSLREVARNGMAIIFKIHE